MSDIRGNDRLTELQQTYAAAKEALDKARVELWKAKAAYTAAEVDLVSYRVHLGRSPRAHLVQCCGPTPVGCKCPCWCHSCRSVSASTCRCGCHNGTASHVGPCSCERSGLLDSGRQPLAGDEPGRCSCGGLLRAGQSECSDCVEEHHPGRGGES